LNHDDVQHTVVVNAACLRVEIDSNDDGACFRHVVRVEDVPSFEKRRLSFPMIEIRNE
jgi:hypothetical protein